MWYWLKEKVTCLEQTLIRSHFPLFAISFSILVKKREHKKDAAAIGAK